MVYIHLHAVIVLIHSICIHTVSQPTLTAPKLIRRGSTWVQIGWSRLDCDGGYPLSQYLVEYRSGSFFSSYDTVASVTSLNYTIRGLLENREYDFRVGRESTESSTTTYSRAASIYTLEIGLYIILWYINFYFVLCTTVALLFLFRARYII